MSNKTVICLLIFENGYEIEGRATVQDVAFKGKKIKTWLGLWKTEISKDREPASFPGNGRHLAFEVDFDDIKKASDWLTKKGIILRPLGGLKPIARSYHQNVSIYFEDPDDNTLELMCNLPEGSPIESSRMMYLSQFEKLVQK